MLYNGVDVYPLFACLLLTKPSPLFYDTDHVGLPVEMLTRLVALNVIYFLWKSVRQSTG